MNSFFSVHFVHMSDELHKRIVFNIHSICLHSVIVVTYVAGINTAVPQLYVDVILLLFSLELHINHS